MKTTSRFHKLQYDALNRKRANEARARQYELFRRTLAAYTGCIVGKEHFFARPEREWRIDVVILDLKIGIEIEGGVWTNGRHVRGKGFIEDMEKYNAAITLGWAILRFTPQDLNKITTFETIKKVVELKKD